MRGLSLEIKLAAVALALCLAGAMGSARLAGVLFERSVEESAIHNLRAAATAFEAHERSEVDKLAATLDALLASADLREAFVARDRERLLALSAPLFRTMLERDRITHWYFITPDDSKVFLRVHKPELHGDPVQRVTLALARRSGELGAGKELGQTAFALRAVRPWYHQGQLIGFMELAEEIDHFLTAIKTRTGDEYGLLVMKKYLDEKAWRQVLGARANTWNDRPEVVVVDTTTFTDGLIDYSGEVNALPDGGLMLGEVLREGRAFVRGVFPVRDAGERKVGALFVLHEFTAQHAAVEAAVLKAAFVLAGAAVVVALGVVWAMRLLVFRRLARLRARLEAAAAAERLPPARVVHLPSDDEVSRLEALLDRALFPARPRSEPPASGPARSRAGDR